MTKVFPTALTSQRFSERKKTSNKRIEYKLFSDSWGIVKFLHHLMLWENEDYPGFLEGAPFKSYVQDPFHKYLHPDIYNSLFPCLVFDEGKKIGHAIEILYWNTVSRKFVYNDPWPLETLLSGFSGINVSSCEQVGYVGEDLWEITPQDLAKVIFAALVPFKITNTDFLHYGTDSKYLLIPFEKEG